MQYCKAIILPLKINLKNTDARIFHKTSVDWIPRIVRHDHRVWPTPGMQRWFNAGKSVNGIHLIDTRKEKNPMSVFFIPAEEASDKIQNKNSHQSGYNKDVFVYNKFMANIILSGEKLKTFLPNWGIRQRCQLSLLLFNISLEVLDIAMRQAKETKIVQIGMEGIKLSLSEDDMLLYIQNTKVCM